MFCAEPRSDPGNASVRKPLLCAQNGLDLLCLPFRLINPGFQQEPWLLCGQFTSSRMLHCWEDLEPRRAPAPELKMSASCLLRSPQHTPAQQIHANHQDGMGGTAQAVSKSLSFACDLNAPSRLLPRTPPLLLLGKQAWAGEAGQLRDRQYKQRLRPFIAHPASV